MTVYELKFISQTTKRLEMKQTLHALLGKLNRNGLIWRLTETEDSFKIYVKTDDSEALQKVIDSEEFQLLSGAIKTLGIKSQTMIKWEKSK
jgi:chromosome segregation and condensation protein ScpB